MRNYDEFTKTLRKEHKLPDRPLKLEYGAVTDTYSLMWEELTSMIKKLAESRFPKKTKTVPTQDWHNGGQVQIHKLAQSLQKAAKNIVQKLRPETTFADEEACPVFYLYRLALELRLKDLVGEGSNFLKSPTDPISLAGTHSVRWLAQIVVQIIRAVGWETDFRCDGVSSSAKFSALIDHFDSLDPVVQAMRGGQSKDGGENFKVVELSKCLDALLNLLTMTADALAATWDAEMLNKKGSQPWEKIDPIIH